MRTVSSSASESRAEFRRRLSSISTVWFSSILMLAHFGILDECSSNECSWTSHKSFNSHHWCSPRNQSRLKPSSTDDGCTRFKVSFRSYWHYSSLNSTQNSHYYNSSFHCQSQWRMKVNFEILKSADFIIKKTTHIIQFHFRWRGDRLGCWNFADWTMRREKGGQLSRMESSSVGAAKGTELATLWAGEDWKVHQEKYRRLQLLPSPTLCLDELVRAAILWHLQSWMHWRFNETSGIVFAQSWHQS